MKIEGAGALVSGGASGLGEATVRRLHAGGADVVIADVNPEKGEALAGELGIPFVQCDVREEDEVQAAVDKAAEAGGGLRIAVSCAGTGIPIKVASSKGPHPLEAFKVLVDINLVGTFNLMRLAAFKMLSVNEPDAEGERGVLINTASVAAFDGQVGQIAYSATKGGVVGMTLPAARDLADKGIRVCTIAPGPVRHAAARRAARGRARLARQRRCRSRAGSAGLPNTRELAAHIVENAMLNGETIRLDGAIRMAPNADGRPEKPIGCRRAARWSVLQPIAWRRRETGGESRTGTLPNVTGLPASPVAARPVPPNRRAAVPPWLGYTSAPRPSTAARSPAMSSSPASARQSQASSSCSTLPSSASTSRSARCRRTAAAQASESAASWSSPVALVGLDRLELIEPAFRERTCAPVVPAGLGCQSPGDQRATRGPGGGEPGEVRERGRRERERLGRRLGQLACVGERLLDDRRPRLGELAVEVGRVEIGVPGLGSVCFTGCSLGGW